ncbi:PepSY domain-containing protein, partial [Pseudomonas canadensis]|uniref:PepSY domain-containing protein n=3 Tax=Pseudomonadota TaxID=1224 RepID=UPI00351A3B33
MIRFVPLKLATAVVALSLAPAAMAAPVCTKVPQAKWMKPAQMKAKVAKMGYRNIKV